MPSSSIPHRSLRVLLPLSIALTVYLYLYPLFQGCAFPAPSDPSPAQLQVAPFRLLTLGDPQLEGDTSLPDLDSLFFLKVRGLLQDVRREKSRESLSALRGALARILCDDIPTLLRLCRKRLDLLGNDFYLAHIFRTLHWWSAPTHVTVLGDLLGSQWISDEEFSRRAGRFWGRVFKHGAKVEDGLISGGRREGLGEDGSWEKRIINVAGNHDIGYAGDLNEERVERFERAFGLVNGEITFSLPLPSRNTSADDGAADHPPTLRLVNLNSMNLDTPAYVSSLQTSTYDFLNEVIKSQPPVEDPSVAVILLTHIPLHKAAGVCVDAPFFEYFSESEGGGIKEQNHISYDLSKGAILQGIFGMSGDPSAAGGGKGRNGIILTGHDHEGCDVYHHVPLDAPRNGSEWHAKRRKAAEAERIDEGVPGVREITVRSMMGEFGGNAGLVSAWFDQVSGRWRIEYAECKLGIQHIWWAVHVLDLMTVGVCVAAAVAWLLEWSSKDRRRPVDEQKMLRVNGVASGKDT